MLTALPCPRRGSARRCVVAVAALAFVWGASPALAHTGAVVAKASFCNPPGPIATPSATGFDYHYAPTYVPEEADRHYRFAWKDGDQDPTGKFSFFYFDHDLPSAFPPESVDGVKADGTSTGTPPEGKIIRVVGGAEARNIYVSCACIAEDGGQSECDAGTLPNCADGGPRWCDNYVDWDTSQLADGSYWIVAVNNDPPYHAYNVSEAPVRVRHGAHALPAVIVVQPDGIGQADDHFQVVAIVAGTGPLTMDIAYGINTPAETERPVHLVASGIAITPAADGTVTYEWDTSKESNAPHFVQVKITDGSGASSYSDSRYAVSIFHRPSDDGGAPDLGSSGPLGGEDAGTSGPGGMKSGGCATGGGDRLGSGFVGLVGLFSLVGLVGVGGLGGRRRAIRRARRGFRSGCTG
jgi:hypothetical protein